MVGLINQDNVRPFFYRFEPSFDVLVFAIQVGMAEDFKFAEGSVDVWDILPKRPFPDGFPGRLGNKEGNIFTIHLMEPLNQHHSDKGFSKTYPIAQKRAPVLCGDS